MIKREEPIPLSSLPSGWWSPEDRSAFRGAPSSWVYAGFETEREWAEWTCPAEPVEEDPADFCR